MRAAIFGELACVVLCLACGGGGPVDGTTPTSRQSAPVASVNVSIANSQLAVGERTQATATLRDAGGSVLTGRPIQWAVADPNIAAIEQNGLVAALAPGTSTVTATAEGKSGTATISVMQPAVAVIALTLSSPWFLTGDREQVTAEARSENGAVLSVPITWTTRDSSVALVAADGTIEARAPGEVSIVARGGGREANVLITVIPGGGERLVGTRAIDSAMIELRRQRGMVGASLSVMENGRLVFARGYGWADSIARRSVNPATSFPMHSISKTVTATATLRAIDMGLLRLSDSAFVIRSDLTPFAGMSEDPRTRAITIAHLLYFASGLLYSYPEPINDCWRGGSLDRDEAVRCIRGLPLAANPGDQVNYTNNGALVLARVLDRVTGKAYPTFVQDEIFGPGGVTGIYLQRAKLVDRPVNETRVYPDDWADNFGTDRGLNAFDGTGGWDGSPSSVLRYLRTVTGGGVQFSILSTATRRLLDTHPAMNGIPTTASTWLGPMFWPLAEGESRRYEGIGQNVGCMYYSHNPTGVSFVFASNTAPPSGEDCWAYGGLLKPIVLRVGSWPPIDLFSR